MASAISVEIEALPSPPTDGVTQLSYLPVTSSSSSLLASTSWDGSVRIHDTLAKTAVLSHVMDSGPLLSVGTPNGATSVITGGLDGSSKIFCARATELSYVGSSNGSNRSTLVLSFIALSAFSLRMFLVFFYSFLLSILSTESRYFKINSPGLRQTYRGSVG
jgi:WD40 repeat protein